MTRELKLTKAQLHALNVLALDDVSYSTWGGEVFGRLPGGIRSRATLWALDRHGLASVTNSGLRYKWGITAAGRAALAQESVS